MPTPTLQAMAALRAVIELKSFKRAGQRLGMTGSAVSKLIAGLEEDVGARLLQRTTRAVAPTEAGEGFYASAVRVLDETELALERLREHDGEPQGVLRVSVPTSFALSWLAPRLPDFLVRHPRLELDLSLNDRFVDLVAERFDCALRIGSDLPDSSLYARRLGAVPRVLVAAPRYLAKAPPLRSPLDLDAHNALLYTLSSTGNAWPFVVDGRRVNVAVSGSFRVDNSVMLRQALLAGIGLTLTPHFVVHDLVADGRLHSLLPQHLAPAHGIHGVTAQRRQVPLKTRVFLDFIESALRQSGYGAAGTRQS